VKRHSVFLRKECDMPPQFDLAQQPCAENWMLLEEIEAPEFDTMIRCAGWYFVLFQEDCSRSGVGLSRGEAIHQALVRALKGLKMRFNAAEVTLLRVSSYPAFHVAKVTLQPRLIQRNTSLETALKDEARVVPAR
jgi:hypothetical protein